MNKFKINILTILLITTFSISTAEADLKTYGKEFFRISSESSQSESLNMVLDKFPILKSDNPCYKLTTPFIPEFTENDDTNWNTFNEFKLILEKWVSNSIAQIESSSSCFPKPTASNWEIEVNNLQSNFYSKLKSEVPTYCVEIPLTKPLFTGDTGKDGEIFNLWVKSTFDPWVIQMITENRLKCGKSDPSNYVEICRSKVKEKSVALDPAFGAYNQYQALWKDKSKLGQLFKDKNWNIENAYKEYSSLISTEIVRLNKIWQLYDIDGNLKSICSQTTAEIYEEWTTIERSRTDLINSFNQLQEIISQIHSSYQETQQQNNSYDDPAVFYEQVDHYYMKYVTSQTDWLKSLGISFSFLTAPPGKPTWINTKDGSNAKSVNDFILAIGNWWSVEGLRIQEAYAEFNLKNILSWSKNLQLSYSEYVMRIAIEKFGSGGTYRFNKPIPIPPQTLLDNPTKSLMEDFENEINDWSKLEIKNLSMENYTPVNNGEVEAQIKVCVSTIEKAKTYFGRLDSQISYLTYIWSDYKRLLEVLKTKNLNLLMYRIQIDQEVNNPYLSDLYDVVPQMLAGVKANCGYTNQTSTNWADTYQQIGKEVTKLQNFLIVISNYFDQYRFTEPKLIPQIGKITQIVGGCRVEILNYDPTFKWYAKGSMVVDINGIATIYNGSIDQYISTEKPGYQTVNFIEGLFKCPGIPILSANTVDVQAPVISLLNLSKSELYRGESFNVSVLITDNREVNNFRISVVDQIGQTFPCYDGVAWKLRTQGDSNVGVYQVECWIRSVSYDGTWKISGSATDLNFNSASFELAKIKVLYGDAPETVRESNSASSSDKDSVSTRTIGTAQTMALIIKDNVKNKQEKTLLLNVVQKISNLPKTTRSSSLNSLTSVKNQINIVVETPKICRYQNGIVRRVAKGICTTSIEIADSTGNTYLITQQLRFR
jgi:hypothetical protein